MKMTWLIVVLVSLSVASLSCAAPETKVLILAGEDSHGWGNHEHHAGAKVLAEALNSSGLKISARVVEDAWPEDAAAFDGVKALVVYSDGEDGHIMNGHVDEMAKLSEKGVGLVCLHYALDVNPGTLQKALLDSVGAYFEVDWSVNPVWTPTEMRVGKHPVARGVKPFEIEDEWHYHMRFRPGMKGVTPVLSVLPPLDTISEEDGPRTGNPTIRDELKQKTWQHLAWTSVNDSGVRGFGFTGGHVHFNWTGDSYRTLVLNAIAWTAGLDIPEKGVPSKTPLIVKNEIMLRAIAKGDVEDVERHIQLGADVNEMATSGMAPIHYAAVRNLEAVGEVLIRHGADVNIISKTGNAPIHFCAERNLPGFAKLLIDNGADLGLGDNSGWTPLHVAAAKDRLDVARVLIDAGANVNKLSNLGGTPLHEAAASGGREIIQLLLDSGIDKSIISKTNKSALEIAKDFKNTVAIVMLED
jgi:type 1 glutamine amidotransferase